MIVVIDYGAGNLRSINRALESQGAEVTISSNLSTIRAAERVVLPGVGNAKAAMHRLKSSGVADAIGDVVNDGKPFLGICLGMQLLFGEQEEGPTFGLGILEGSAKKLSGNVKVPHMGWNTVSFNPDSVLATFPPTPYYFVHSYAVHPNNAPTTAGTTEYGGTFASVVIDGNVWGTQFHPEKSGAAGLALLNIWLNWNPDEQHQ